MVAVDRDRAGLGQAEARPAVRGQLAEGLIAAAGVRAGQRVLDVGCGPGPLTSALAALVGAERVAGVDPSQDFVAACGERVPGADVHVGVAERLPFEDDGFDAVLAQARGNSGSVYQNLDDADRARLRAEAYRLLGEPAGGFTLIARAWWVRGEA